MKDPSAAQGTFFQMMDELLGCALMSEDMQSAPVVYGPLWLENCILPETNNPFQIVLQQMLADAEVSSQEGCIQKVGELLPRLLPPSPRVALS